MIRIPACPLKRFYQKNAMYLACFALPAFIILAVYFGRGVFPIRDHSVLVLDLNAQYIYYYEAFRQAILEGKSLLYSWSQSLSGEMIGIFGYYLASPFMLIFLIFPKVLIVEALLVITVLKAGTLAVTFAIFLRRNFSMDGIRLIIFSTLYALMAYTVVNAMNPMWIDGVILLPLIALGIIEFIDERRFLLFCVSLSLALITNYYIGYMLCILSVVYFFYYYFSKPRTGGFRGFMAVFARFAGLGILCGAISAVILLPIYHSLALGKIEFTKPDFSLTTRFDMFNILPKFLLDSYDSVNVQGLPMVYCGLISLLLLPGFFLAPGIPIRKKVATGGLLLVTFAIMNISLLDIAMHCFRLPNWLNYRYSFFFSFIILAAAAEGFMHLSEIPRGKIIKTYVLVLVLIAIIQLSHHSYIDNFTSIWLSILFVSLYALFLCLSQNPLRRETYLRALAFIVIAELTVNTALTIQDIHKEVYYSGRFSYTDFVAETRAVVAAVEAYDPDFYRMEKTYHRTVNDPMAFGYAGLSHSTSTLNARALDVIRRLGYSQREHWSRYVVNSPIADSLLGFRYILSKTPLEQPNVEVMTMGEITVYENPYALPILFAADEGYPDSEINSSVPATFQNQLLSALTGDNGTSYLEPIRQITKTLDGVTEASYGTHKKFTLDGGVGYLSYTFDAPRSGPLYLGMQSEYKNSCTVTVNDREVGSILGHETTALLPLGTHEAGDAVTVTLTMREQDASSGAFYLRNASEYFFSLDTEAFEAAYEKLLSGGITFTERRETYLRGVITVSDERASVYTSIPYEGGWTITVDGQRTLVKIGANSFVTFDITQGTHEIEMSYTPPGLLLGAAVSIAGVITLVFLTLIQKQRKTRV